MDITQTIALTMGIAWASGINLYATILVLGYMGMTGNIDLPPDLQILADPMVMIAAGLMYTIEFFADKVPGVDTGWDTLHTFIRIPAGAVLAAGAVGEVGTGAQLAAGLVGGTLATGSHVTKAGVHPGQKTHHRDDAHQAKYHCAQHDPGTQLVTPQVTPRQLDQHISSHDCLLSGR